jgi:hypothetical protein
MTGRVIPPNRAAYRILHIDNLPTLVARQALHAPRHVPDDGHPPYRTIHNPSVQASRAGYPIACGPGGTIHDYVPFYLGPRSVMLYQLHTGWVTGYTEGQSPLVYAVTSLLRVEASGRPWVFSDGHGLARLTHWYDDPANLDKVDWETVNSRMWKDTNADPDRQRRKQSELLVHEHLPWSALVGIAVLNDAVGKQVETILQANPATAGTPVKAKPEWYY